MRRDGRFRYRCGNVLPSSFNWSGLGECNVSKPVRRRGFPVRGELLRSLRREQGWTQEEAAHRARVSEKLFRKAEQGGRIDGRSLAALAAIFPGDSRGSLRSQDLLLSQAPTLMPGKSLAATRGDSQAGRILEEWLRAIWEQRSVESLDRWIAPAIVFHCELGILHGREAVQRRYAHWCAGVERPPLTIEALKQSGESAVCRWRAGNSAEEGGEPATHQQASMGGATAIRLREGMVWEASEFLDSRHLYQQLESEATDHAKRASGENIAS